MKAIFGDASYLQLRNDQKMSLTIFAIGFAALLISLCGMGTKAPWLFFFGSFGVGSIGALMFMRQTYGGVISGIKNNNITQMTHTSKGALAWVLGILMTSFYICLYWFPEHLESLIRMMDPFSHLLRGQGANQWFLYGTFYTFSVLVMGYRSLLKYRHSKYMVYRTLSVMFFQLFLAFLIPALLLRLNQPEFYFSYFWPLSYYTFFPSNWDTLVSSGNLGMFMFFWAMVMSFVATPILTFFYGKRWYCSWVCGCGGLAETMGDPFRQLSDKSLKAWKYERYIIYPVLAFIIVTTIVVWINSYYGGSILGNLSNVTKKWYGFFIGAAFSGVIGVGFYPLMGSRVWCRFGCPMAAILGIFQRFWSRFRITTNGAQCISCGNCSTYCEMGIDVRWYAQRGQNIVRSSCVGCGICSAVCPRGVLSLENGKKDGRNPEELSLIQDLKSGGL